MKLNFDAEVKQKSDEELINIYINSDNYQTEFIDVVKNELRYRDIDITIAESKREEKQVAIDNLMSTGKKGNKAYIILGFISALFGGFLGIIAGYIYSQSKHRDNPRHNFYVYNEETRKYGLGMMVTGIIVFVYTVSNYFD